MHPLRSAVSAVALSACSCAAYENEPRTEIVSNRGRNLETLIGHQKDQPLYARQDSNRLLDWVLTPLPLGSIQANGWLYDQLFLMGEGLAGHEHDFYKYVNQSSWLGGNSSIGEYSDLNEGLPYWLNGLVPLAYYLDDSRLKDQVHSAVNYILDHQSSDGWLGPEMGTGRNFWARFPLALGLTQLVEVNSTWEEPVVGALHRFSELMHSMLADNYTGMIYHEGDSLAKDDFQWGRVRAQDMIITLQWLYEKYPQNNSQLLWDNMQYLYDGSLKWEAWYNEAVYLKQDIENVSNTILDTDFPYLHGVNIGQGLKAAAVIRRFTHNDSLLMTAWKGVNWTFEYHGSSSGSVLADEREEGLNPWAGSELCTAVETMYSLSYLYQTLGNGYYADRAELAAFNALPVMVTPDWWAHQYMAQPNQPWATNLTATPFWNVQPWGQTFGLEPDYPCCTVNHPQGYPKFLSAVYARVGDNGLAQALLSPATVTTTLSSGQVTVKCNTNYPFAHTLAYSVNATGSFDFYIRIPSWYLPSTSNITINGTSAEPLSPDSTSSLHKVSLPSGTSTITLSLGADIYIEPRVNDTIAVHYGALLFALDVGSTNSSTGPRNYRTWSLYGDDYAPSQSRDYILTNTSTWNVAIDPTTLELHTNDNYTTEALPNPIFAEGASPVWMTVQACEIDWPLWLDSVPGTPPAAPRTCLGDHFEVTLVPYGTAKLHMAELPTVDLSAPGAFMWYVLELAESLLATADSPAGSITG